MAGVKTVLSVLAGAVLFGVLEHKVFSLVAPGQVIEPNTNTTVGDAITYGVCVALLFIPKVPRFVRLMAVGGLAFEVTEMVVWLLREY